MKERIVFIFIMLISFLLVSIFLFWLSEDGYVFFSNPINFKKTSVIGPFIGGVIGSIFSGAGFYYLYVTFNQQKNSFELEQFERKFFKLLKLHIDNVKEYKFDGMNLYDKTNYILNREYKSNMVFYVIFIQFYQCKKEIECKFLKSDEIFEESYLKELNNNIFLSNLKSYIELALIDICYSIVFYGVENEGCVRLKNLFHNRYKEKFTEKIINSIKHKTSIDINDAISEKSDGYKPYYSGHYFYLEKYYRHFYQMIRYINSKDNLKYKIKYRYTNILVAQLSNYEQIILFFNSLSRIGEVWEMCSEIDKSLKNYSDFDFKFITKFDLIKNIPNDNIFGINFKMYYPDVQYESDKTKVKERKRYK